MKCKIRPIRIEGDCAFVTLSAGYVCVIDAADVDLINVGNWSAHVSRRGDGSVLTVYAFRQICDENGRRGRALMHRLIAGTPAGLQTDHIDGDGLNNRRANLRNATKTQNGRYIRRPLHNTSGVKGVSWHKGSNKWRASIKCDGKSRALGSFKSIAEAAEAYAAASAELHGEFGRLS
jgi:hypothetical protein